MIRTRAFAQAVFTGPLPAPNNTGVCFSLSMNWLANHCEAAFVESVGSASQDVYAPGSSNPVNQIQSGGNQVESGQMAMADLLAIIHAIYPNVTNPVPVNAVPQPFNFVNLVNQMGAVPHANNLVWMINPGGRGHIVAFNTTQGKFFDANNGFYNAEANLVAEVASFLDIEYAHAGMTLFMVWSMQIA